MHGVRKCTKRYLNREMNREAQRRTSIGLRDKNAGSHGFTLTGRRGWGSHAQRNVTHFPYLGNDQVNQTYLGGEKREVGVVLSLNILDREPASRHQGTKASLSGPASSTANDDPSETDSLINTKQRLQIPIAVKATGT
ncbi:Uncharacterized protein HZ326_15021 [Fusarium oxysporum f. sp. albedinis]|nr:Uncharacterized protein HZ326_15021 [Fusarium oxysporum f. sp. albedinis]